MFKAQNYNNIIKERSMSSSRRRQSINLPSIKTININSTNKNNTKTSTQQHHKSIDKSKDKISGYTQMLQFKLTKPFTNRKNELFNELPWMNKPVDINQQTIKISRIRHSIQKNIQQVRSKRNSVFDRNEIQLCKTKVIRQYQMIEDYDSKLQTKRLVKMYSNKQNNLPKYKRNQCKIAFKGIFPKEQKHKQYDKLQMQFNINEKLSTINRDEDNISQFISMDSFNHLNF